MGCTAWGHASIITDGHFSFFSLSHWNEGETKRNTKIKGNKNKISMK